MLFTFHDLRHTFGTRLADAGVDVVEIKDVMGHLGRSPSCQSIDNNVAEKMVTRWSQRKNGRPNIHWNLPLFIENNGEPWRARTSDPLIKSQLLYQLS